RTWFDETGVERFRACGTPYVGVIYRHRWIGGRMMHFVTDIAPFDGVADLDGYRSGLESRRHIQHLDSHNRLRSDCGSSCQECYDCKGGRQSNRQHHVVHGNAERAATSRLYERCIVTRHDIASLSLLSLSTGLIAPAAETL